MTPQSPALDLSRVYRQCVFRSRNAAESHSQLKHAINDHKLTWSPGPVDSSMFGTRSRRLQLMILRYGPEVEVEPNPFEDFALVQMPLRGRTVIESDGVSASLGPGQAAVIAPRHRLRLRWSENCEQLILRIPHALAEDAAARTAAAIDPHFSVDEVPSVSIMDPATSSQWCGLVQTLVDLLLPDAQAARCHPAWLDHIELGFGLFLRTQAVARPASSHEQPSGHASTANGTVEPGSTAFALAVAERYVRARMSAPIALEDLARAAGMSPRSLHTCCKQQLGVSPMTWLRDLRLDAARKRFQNDLQTNVTDVALSVGFGHLGRFSAYYRERFGELPRATTERPTHRGASPAFR